ncbi:MAG: murein hydrolase activator EnvC [Enterobacteriaceae bacterium]
MPHYRYSKRTQGLQQNRPIQEIPVARCHGWTGLSPLLLCSVLIFWPSLSHGQNNQQQLKTLQQDIATRQEQMAQQQQQRDKLQGQLREQEEVIARAGKSLHETEQQLSSLHKEIQQLNNSIKKLQEKSTAQQHYLAQQIEMAFRLGKDAPLALLFNTEETLRRERILAYFNYLNQARERALQALSVTQKSLEQQKVELQGKQDQQQQLAQQKKKEQLKLEESQKSRHKTLTSMEASLQEQQEKLQELKKNEAQLRDKIALAEKQARERAQREAREAARIREKEQQAKKTGGSYRPTADEKSLMARTGGLGRPAGHYIWPVRGKILHHFGDVDQGELRWKGMVIAAPEGKEVKAIADGHVLLADWLQGYGLVVVIEHGKGDMSLYGYNQTALVPVGSQVKAGEPIALVGSSGGQQQPALYFEIRRQGQAVNPQPWLEK